MDFTSIFADSDFKPHFNEKITDEEYHTDRTCVGSSQLRRVLDSPKAFHYDFFIKESEDEKEEFRIGKIIHTALLEGEKFKENYIIAPDFGDQRSKANRESKQNFHESLAPQSIVLSKDDFELVHGIVESVLDHPQSRGLFANGRPEVAGYFVDKKTGIKLKIKPDLLSFDRSSLLDVKSTKSSELNKFMTSAFGFRYDFQLYMYSLGVEYITGKFPDLRTILAVEKTPPYESAYYYFNDFALEQAASDFRKSLDILAQCLESNKWPQRQKIIEPARIPQWFINKNVEE